MKTPVKLVVMDLDARCTLADDGERAPESARLGHVHDGFDQWRRAAGNGRFREVELPDAEAMRQELLQLHGMAHELINEGENFAGSSSKEAIWEIAENLSSEILDFMAGLEAAYKTLDELGELAPDEDWEEDDN